MATDEEAEPTDFLVPVLRQDGTTKKMSERQLRLNLEPGDYVYAICQGRRVRVAGDVAWTADFKVGIDTGEPVPIKVYWADVLYAELEHPERIQEV